MPKTLNEALLADKFYAALNLPQSATLVVFGSFDEFRK